MRRSTREQLASDLKEFGVRMASGEARTSIPVQEERFRRMKEWIGEHGTSDPMAYPDVKYIFGGVPEAWEEEAYETPAETQRVLLVGDTHAAPNQDLRRFTWLGRAIEELAPDEVVMFGDHWALDGLCSQESTLKREGSRFLEEREAGNKALRMIDAELGSWSGRKILLGGNHGEGRVARLEGMNAYLEGALDLWGEAEGMGYNYVPFLKPHRVAGFRCQHYFPNGAGRATSSKVGNARAVLQNIHFGESVAFGHTHVKDYWQVSPAAGGTKRGINVGCYFEHFEDYAGEDGNANWWRGLLLLENAANGDADVQEFRMSTIRERWGSR